MAEKVTIYDISKKLNISAATVSRALNNNPKISQKTRELVLKTAAKMNYKQNRLAQALKSGRTNNVGVIVPFINRSFFSSVIRGIEEELSPHGYHVIICQSHEDVDNEIKQIDTLLNTQVDGIFMSVAKTTQDTSHIQKALAENTPLVFFDRKKDVPGLSSVIIDDFKGGYLATQHLIKQGCKKIAHFSGDLSVEIYKNRHQGYLKALKDHGITPLSRFSLQVNSKLESGISAVKELWEFEEKPDAIFSASDYAALGAIQELRKIGIKIPKEVCVVGFSNEPFTKYMELPITSVDQTPFEMGKIAAQVFLEQIESQILTAEKKVVLAPELYIRDSSNRNL
ncbi:MAG: LacI family DNA-binding transcriptional regulator [Zunongwangia sp.]|jgi:LacI family transcriptional regulator|uniref:Transcriptional regulator n=1 Tax=Zunongwangia profunda (strain DSM 18752 / CCTCC AB 206139 / SM-A87) TaxID=655815 RepID=D5BGU0_ZUNPS|nr:LacI family DNA-binding transcriptional regulator [Zunongwangia profunda]ADF53271.1 Transcriptional regulator [Zunongwangia profunda SM-A87]